MAEKPTLKLSEILETLNSASKTAEDGEDKDTSAVADDVVKEDTETKPEDDRKDESNDSEKVEDDKAEDSDSDEKDDDSEDDKEETKDDSTEGDSLGDALKDIAKEASEKHRDALVKEAQIFGTAFADSVLERLYAASEHQKLAAVYEDTYSFAMQKLANGMMDPSMVPMPPQGAMPPQQMPAAPMAPQPQVVDPNYGMVYPTPVAAPNLPGYVEAPQQQVAPGAGEQIYPQSLPAEQPAPEQPQGDIYPESLPEEEAPKGDPNVEAVSKAVSSAANAAAQAARAASMLTEVINPQNEQPAEAPEEAAPSPEFAGAYDETQQALQGM